MIPMKTWVIAVEVTPVECDCPKCEGHDPAWEEVGEMFVIAVSVAPSRTWGEFKERLFRCLIKGRAVQLRPVDGCYCDLETAYEAYHQRRWDGIAPVGWEVLS